MDVTDPVRVSPTPRSSDPTSSTPAHVARAAVHADAITTATSMSIFLPIAPDATCPDRAPDGDPHPDLFWQGTLEALFLFTVYFLPASLLSPPPPVSDGPTVRAPSMFYSLLYFQNPAQQRPSLSTISAPATDTLFMTSRNSQGPLGAK